MPRRWSRPSTRRASTRSRRCCTPRASTPTSCGGSGCRSGTSTGRCGATCSTGCTTRRSEVTVALVGKYIDLPDAYLSVSEALRAGGVRAPRTGADPLGGLGLVRDAGRRGGRAGRRGRGRHPGRVRHPRASRARSARCRYARERGIPTLGLCLGLQCMVIECARAPRRHRATRTRPSSTRRRPIR